MKHRFEVLDIFRGLFASLVFMFHLGPFANTPILNNRFIENSDMFVDFFFVLSGFVIAYSYQSLADWGQFGLFLKKRVYRIYPLHFVMLLAFVGMEVAKNLLVPYIKVNNLVNPANNVYTFFTSLFLINSTPVPGVRDVSWNIPSWSISAEMMAYLVFGSLVVFIHRSNQFRSRNAWYGLMIVISLAALWSVSNSFQINYSFDYGFLRGILGFFTGVLCFNFFSVTHVRVREWSPALFSAAEAISLGLICLSIYNGELMKPWGAVFEILFFICIYTFSFEKGLISKGLKSVRLLHKLGQYSYSIYMTHALLISLFNVLFIRILKFPPEAYSYLFIVNFVLIYFVSAWTYKHIEMRFQYKSPKKVQEGEMARK
ncbi:MAG: acyltransferase family protein [Dyadobacter fermentans]